jgi:hypothetical protein
MYSCVFRPWVITSFGKRGEPTFGDVYRHDRSMIDPAEILVDIVVFGVSSVAKTTPRARAASPVFLGSAGAICVLSYFLLWVITSVG